MIRETTGEMLEVTNTVALRGSECICYCRCLGCPRGKLSYWRGIWLERVQKAHAGAPTEIGSG